MSAILESEQTKSICPECKELVEYVEFECNKPFTAPAELKFKALTVWGAYSAEKETLCQTSEFVHFRFGNGHEKLVKMLGFDREKFWQEQEALRNAKKPCEQKKCKAEGNAIFTMFDPDEPIAYYCDEHCFDNGACPGCYYFLAGMESFDFSTTGFCSECQEQIDADCREDYDDPDYGYEDFDERDAAYDRED